MSALFNRVPVSLKWFNWGMFLLSEHNAFDYLVNLGICDRQHRPIEILPLRGKNLNLHLKFADSPGWLVKQEVMDQQGCSELFLGEWAVQDLINNTHRLAPLRTFIPPIVHYDPEAAILVSQFLEGHQNLESYDQLWDCPFGRDIAASLGRNLGTLHQLTYQPNGTEIRDHLECLYPDAVRSSPPSSFSALRPFIPEMLGWVRQDALTFFRWYQSQPPLIQALETLSKTWSACCLTHQDLQFGNWLLNRETRSLQLIDWEHAGWGDPLTDLATLLTHPLQLWLSQLPPPSFGSWQQRCDAATLPFEKIQPSLMAIASSYFEAFPEALSESTLPESTLPRVLQWTGRRLIDEVETRIQYHFAIGPVEANLLHFAQQLILHPDGLVPVLFNQAL